MKERAKIERTMDEIGANPLHRDHKNSLQVLGASSLQCWLFDLSTVHNIQLYPAVTITEITVRLINFLLGAWCLLKHILFLTITSQYGGGATHFQLRDMRLERGEDLCTRMARWWGLGPKHSSKSADSKHAASLLKPLLLRPAPG